MKKFVVTLASLLPGKERGKKWVELMTELEKTKVENKAKKIAEAEFNMFSEEKQYMLVWSAWMRKMAIVREQLSTSSRKRAEQALIMALLPWAEANLVPTTPKKHVRFSDVYVTNVPREMLQGKNITYR